MYDIIWRWVILILSLSLSWLLELDKLTHSSDLIRFANPYECSLPLMIHNGDQEQTPPLPYVPRDATVPRSARCCEMEMTTTELLHENYTSIYNRVEVSLKVPFPGYQ